MPCRFGQCQTAKPRKVAGASGAAMPAPNRRKLHFRLVLRLPSEKSGCRAAPSRGQLVFQNFGVVGHVRHGGACHCLPRLLRHHVGESHIRTPPWCEQVPRRHRLDEREPSRQRATVVLATNAPPKRASKIMNVMAVKAARIVFNSSVTATSSPVQSLNSR